MNIRVGAFISIGVAVIALAGCVRSSTQPSGTSSVVAPRGVLPAPNATVRYIDQPVTLSIANAVVTNPAGSTYTFEVSNDTNFGTKVQTKADIAEGASGQTSVKLDQLAGGSDYYWHARASSGGTVGVFGTTYRFTVGPPIVVSAATPVSPTSGAQVGSMPTFTVTNAARSGPVGAITYGFEVSSSPAFSSNVLAVTVPEGSGGRTSYVSSVELPAQTTLFWRVTATDAANGVSSPVSSTTSFVTALAIDLSKVVYLNSPNISSWRRTGFLEIVEQDGNEATGGPVCTRFTDPGWPDSPWPYGAPNEAPGSVFANQWYFANIGGAWYGGAGEWIYRAGYARSSCKLGQTTTNIGPDAGFGEPFASWRPRVGELVGFAISAVARKGSVPRTVDERTQVVVQPWIDTARGSALGAPQFTFAAPGIR